jgi:phenylacetate-CoA ligase
MKFHEKALLTQIKYAYERSGLYKNKYRTIDIENFSIEEFSELPFTDKREIVEDQTTYPPYGSNLCAALTQLSRIHKTSGTTGKAIIIALTATDVKNVVKAGSSCFSASGLTAKDTVVHCLNYCMWAGGYTDHQSLEATGATVIPFGVGNSEELINMILTLKPNAIHCTPSYLSRLEQILKEKFNKEPKYLGLTLGLFGGEGGLQNKNIRTSLEAKWGFLAMNANYGVSEVLSTYGAECIERDGLHFFGDDIVFPELIDTVTEKSVPIVTGQVGELVLSTLHKDAQPLLRYRTHDLIRIISNEPCKCGRISFRFEIIGRSDDMLVIKGLNVFPKSIENVINSHLDVLNGEYQIIVSKEEPKEYIKIVMEAKVKAEVISQAFIQMLCKEFKAHTTILPIVNFVDKNTFERVEGKTKRIIKV